MMKLLSISVIKGAMVTGLLLLAQGQVVAAGLVIKGSTTVQPILEAAAQGYQQQHRGTRVEIHATGSTAGIRALLEGDAGIAASSRMLEKQEIEEFSAMGIYPVTFRIAYDSIVPIVHPSNPVRDLSMEQLNDIYSGKITNWRAVGGPDLEIAVIERNQQSGTYRLWHDKVTKNGAESSAATYAESNTDVVARVSRQPGAVGYIGLGYINIRVKPLSIGGKMANMRDSKNGDYVLGRPLFLFTRDWPDGQTLSFIDYLLHPRQGQRIVEESGFIPLY